MLTPITGQTRQAAGRQAGGSSATVRDGATMERCGLRAWSAATQERGYHQAGDRRLQGGPGGGIAGRTPFAMSTAWMSCVCLSSAWVGRLRVDHGATVLEMASRIKVGAFVFRFSIGFMGCGFLFCRLVDDIPIYALRSNVPCVQHMWKKP